MWGTHTGYHFPGGPGPWWASHPILNKWGHWKTERWGLGLIEHDDDDRRRERGKRDHGLQSTRGHVQYADVAQWHTEGLIGFDCSVTDRLGRAVTVTLAGIFANCKIPPNLHYFQVPVYLLHQHAFGSCIKGRGKGKRNPKRGSKKTPHVHKHA